MLALEKDKEQTRRLPAMGESGEAALQAQVAALQAQLRQTALAAEEEAALLVARLTAQARPTLPFGIQSGLGLGLGLVTLPFEIPLKA